MNALTDIFERKGSPFRADGNRPLPLDTPDTLWIVKKGEVDVFFQRIHGDGSTGRRHHLLRVRTGRLLFGFQRDAAGSDVVLLAAGRPGTELAACGRAVVEEAIKDDSCRLDFAAMLEQWIGALSERLARDESVPRRTGDLECGSEIQLGGDVPYSPRSAILWTRFQKGTLRLMGRDDMLLRENILFPISSRIWIGASDGAVVDLLDTLEVLKLGGVWNFLNEFHTAVLRYAGLETEYDDMVERKRLEQRTRVEEQAMNEALHRMDSVLKPQTAAITAERTGEDALVLACRAICKELGIELTVPETERGKTGETVSLSKIARASRFRTRRVILRERWWKEDNGPLLAFMKGDKRPVALIPAAGNKCFLHDPLNKSRVRVTNRNASEIEPAAYMIYRSFPQRKLSGKDILKFGLAGCGRNIAAVAGLGIAGAALGVLCPVLASYIYDSVVPEASRVLLVQIVLVLLASAAGILLFQAARAMAVVRVEGKITHNIQAALWDRLLSLPIPFFRRYAAGDLTKRGLGIFAIDRALSTVAVDAVLTFIFSVFYLGLFIFFLPELALVAVGVTAFMIVITGFLVFRQLRYQREISFIEGNNASVVLQLLSGMAKLKVFGAENRAFEVWSRLFTRKKRLAYRSGVIGSFIEALNAAFPVIILIAIFAWILARDSAETSVGVFIAFVTAFAVFQTALLQLVSTISRSSMVISYYERARPIIETLPETDETKAHPGELSGDIEISQVNFRYKEDGPRVLRDVSLKVKPGEFVALVGESGSGKSTLLRLLLGFEALESGTIYYDGQDMAMLDIRELRNQMGVVLQTGKLVPGDIFKNIVGSSNLTVDDAWEAARLVGLEEDIKAMPMGMYTFVGAQGGCFSGGQRQRLLIARAIAHRPRILFFDEATSALDNLTQARLAANIEKLHCTRIAIAHRLSTVMHADRIYVLHKGRLVETGGYEELMNRKGVFFDLAARQLA